ncbi:hypothetical protein [Streptomyces sp. KR80]|uniref:hypothetical protein n=1 Tax=Streptomyces sp. KR80 TaxID=3457426 RepID=UPI003FD20EBF
MARPETSPCCSSTASSPGSGISRSGRSCAITVEPFGRLSAAHRREPDERVARSGEFLEAESAWTLGTVTVGGHA